MSRNPDFNVLFIIADQWRGDCLSCLDHPDVRTPQLDRLAEEAFVFSSHYAQASPCSPSRACIYTGMYQKNHRVLINGSPLDSRHANLAWEARKAGYEPALFGYTDTSLDPRTRHANDPSLKIYEQRLPGFDSEVYLPAEKPLRWLSWLAEQGVEVDFKNPNSVYRPVAERGKAPIRLPTRDPARFNADQTQSAFLVNETLKYVEARTEPWFVHLSLFSPHPPFVAPFPFNGMYDPEKIAGPLLANDRTTDWDSSPLIRWYAEKNRCIAKEGYFSHDFAGLSALDERDLRCVRATYFGMVSEVDAQIGRLLDALREGNLYDTTLVVFTSDHGEMAGDHHLLGKVGFHEASNHIPLIIKPPGRTASRKVGDFTQSVDLFPTFSEFFGLEIPRQCEGHSLLPLLKETGSLASLNEAVFWEYCFMDYWNGEMEEKFGLRPKDCLVNVMRDRKYKFVYQNRIGPLLFDLESDPHEMNDLARRKTSVPVLLEYFQKMLEWRIRTEEKTLTHYNRGKINPDYL